MKVLVHGKKYHKNNKPKIISCPHCECVFEYKNEEKKYLIREFDFTYSKITSKTDIFYINCPECRKIIKLGSD